MMRAYHCQLPHASSRKQYCTMKLVVPGGNGFVGQHICRLTVEAGHEVIAFGRSGAPDLTPVRNPWINKVEWHACDIFDVGAWRPLLDGADAVIYCIGTITQDVERGITFDRVNGESAILAADVAAEAGVGTFVKLSVQDKPPFVSGRFLASMRRPERSIPQQHPELRCVFLRPNLIFGGERPGTGTAGALMQAVGNAIPFGYGDPSGRPLPVQLVAAAAVHAAVTDTLSGCLDVDQVAGIGRTSGLVDIDDLPEASLQPFLASVGGAAVGYWLLKRLFR